MHVKKDIILVVGPLAAGKTYTINFLRAWAKEKQISFEEHIYSDAETLIKYMEEDDATGGFYHYHAWCKGQINGHSHANGELKFPMTFYGNNIVDKMYRNLFEALEKLQYTGKYYFVEFAGGDNSNPPDTLEAHINYSFARMAKMLEKGALPNKWLERVYAVIHPTTDLNKRLLLNKRKSPESLSQVEKGFASLFNVKASMQVTGKDDFIEIQTLFKNSEVPHIYSAQNTGDHVYEKNLTKIASQVFSTETKIYIAGVKMPERDIVLIAGRNGSGKKVILHKLYQTAQKHNLDYQSNLISDFDILYKHILLDDQRGGFSHYHDWCREKLNGHSHNNNKEKTPFMVTNNDLLNEVFGEYFITLNNLPRNGKLWFAEWSGGINTNPSYEPSAGIDISFGRISSLLQRGVYPTDWIQRIYAIIHPFEEDIIRGSLSEEKEAQALEKLTQETLSLSKKNATILAMFGKDDFFTIEKFFAETQVPYRYHFSYDRKVQLDSYATHIGSLVLQPFCYRS